VFLAVHVSDLIIFIQIHWSVDICSKI